MSQIEETVLNAISLATNPYSEMALAERRKSVAWAICRLIDADIWLWFTGEVNPKVLGDSMVTSFVDGGFRDESERAEFFRVIIHPDLVPIATTPLSNAMHSQKSITRCRDQLISDADWEKSPIGIIWKKLGFEDFIISAYPVGKSGYSALGFHRRIDKPRFAAHDTMLVDVISHCLTWLHLAVTPVQASNFVLQLSPRERQVVLFLISGDTRKQVAEKLGLSEHTVSDYMKEIYTKFEVKSRAELLSKFIVGENQL